MAEPEHFYIVVEDGAPDPPQLHKVEFAVTAERFEARAGRPPGTPMLFTPETFGRSLYRDTAKAAVAAWEASLLARIAAADNLLAELLLRVEVEVTPGYGVDEEPKCPVCHRPAWYGHGATPGVLRCKQHADPTLPVTTPEPEVQP